MLFIGRTINGFALGWGLGLAPTYIMEMCLPHQKGTAAMASTIAQSAALVVCHVCGFEELLGNRERWLYLIGLPLILLCLQLILLPLCPQNPRYLLMKRNDEPGAIRGDTLLLFLLLHY
ncbi:unnamed protein product [Candidula unifasciata]|uniref:Major facilitator superfamily (MFS) profile domain-containing protein n=1 Tax=Candidula unifasciata TaxID=100452 RepID=A0A8S3ZZ07_9EUPU|nr:unnamed protein product [Candidula unifasciata]